jgi:hypothetical protein
MDLLTYTIKYFKENDVIQHDSLEEEIDFLTQKVNELKDKQHELNVNYSEIMKCTEDEIKQKYDEYRNIRLEEIKNQYNNYIAEQTELTNLLAQINSITDYNSYMVNIKNNIINDLTESTERLLLPKEIPSFDSWKNGITEDYDYYLRKYEMEIVGYESKLDRFKKLLNVLKEVKDN